VLLLVLAIGALVVIGANLGGNETASDTDPTSGDDAEASGESVDAFSLSIGDCILDPLEGESEGEVFDVESVDCEQSHDSEVFALIDHPAGEDEAFVGTEEIVEFAGMSCEEEFEEFIGVSYAESEYFLTFLHPTDASWEDGDREVVCLVYDEDGPVSGSLQDAGS